MTLLAAAVSKERWPDTYFALERHRRQRPLPVKKQLVNIFLRKKLTNPLPVRCDFPEAAEFSE